MHSIFSNFSEYVRLSLVHRPHVLSDDMYLPISSKHEMISISSSRVLLQHVPCVLIAYVSISIRSKTQQTLHYEDVVCRCNIVSHVEQYLLLWSYATPQIDSKDSPFQRAMFFQGPMLGLHVCVCVCVRKREREREKERELSPIKQEREMEKIDNIRITPSITLR